MRTLLVATIGAALLGSACATTQYLGQAVVTCVKATETAWSDCVITETSGNPELDTVALNVARRARISPGSHEAELSVGERGTRTIHVKVD